MPWRAVSSTKCEGSTASCTTSRRSLPARSSGSNPTRSIADPVMGQSWIRDFFGGGMDTSVRRAYIDLRSEEHTSELQSRRDLVCRLLLEKKKKQKNMI